MRRLATPEDRETVYAIYSHDEVVPFLSYDPMPAEDFAPIYQGLLDSGSFYLWEAGDGGVAGFYRVARLPGRARHVAQLGTVAVDPRRHGQGVAKAMLADAIERLRAEGILRVELYAESDNPRALRFYERLGFEREGLLRGFYKRAHQSHYVDECVLGLLLAPPPSDAR